MEPLISAKDLKKNFGKVEALKGGSLDVAEGEKVVVIGPSGSKVVSVAPVVMPIS